MDGTNLPPNGFTVATPNPLYIWGIYNCPTVATQGTTNTLATSPSSVACDAITILSPLLDRCRDGRRTRRGCQQWIR